MARYAASLACACTVLLLAAPSATAAVFTVQSTGDGPGICDSLTCTLRQAIIDANATAGTDHIDFNIPPGGTQTIQPLSELPEITDTTVIDGTTQPGFSGTPIIELDGSLAGASSDGLTITRAPAAARCVGS